MWTPTNAKVAVFASRLGIGGGLLVFWSGVVFVDASGGIEIQTALYAAGNPVKLFPPGD